MNDSEWRFLDLLARQAADLIEQRKNKIELREREEQFRRSVLDAPIPVIMHAEDGEVLQISRSWTELTGYTIEDSHVIQNWLTRADGFGGEDVREAVSGAFAPRDGDRPMRGAIFEITTRQGAEDITERRLAEERVRAGEERYRLLLQSVVDYAIFTTDRDGIVTSWPAGAEAVYGWSEEEIVGQSADLTFLPEDVASGAPRIERDTALREGLAPNVRWHRHRDGGRIFIDGSTQPLVGADGTVREFIKIGQDVTEAWRLEQSVRDSEERLRNAVEVGRLGLWDWNIVSGKVHWSGEHYRMEGYEPGEVTPSFEAWADRLHADDRDAAVAALERAMDEREEYACEFRVVHPDGTIHWLAARGRFFYDEDGSPVRMIGAMIDTTDRRNWEDRQKVLVAELQHRTRNLIGVVRSISERTASNSTDLEDFKARFRDRIAALARVQGLLSQLDRSEQVTFDDLLHTELASMGATAGEVRLDGPPGVRLRSSAVQTLALGLHELATNAIKYGALGQAGASLFITWSVEARQNGGKSILHIDWRRRGSDVRQYRFRHAARPRAGIDRGGAALSARREDILCPRRGRRALHDRNACRAQALEDAPHDKARTHRPRNPRGRRRILACLRNQDPPVRCRCAARRAGGDTARRAGGGRA